MSRAKAPKLAKPSRPKIVAFGPPGIGKTWASLDWPDCFYIDCEGGASLDHYTDKLTNVGALYLGPEDGACDYDVVLEEVRELATTQHDRKTLIIDSFTKLFQTTIQIESDRLAADHKKNEFGVDKKPAVSKSRQLVKWLDRLDMNALLICHEKAKWKQGEQVGETFDGWEKLEYELNLVVRIMRQGPDRKAKVVKSRFESFSEGDMVDWSYAEFARRFGREVLESGSEAVELATVQQVERIQKLVDVLRIDSADVQKLWDGSGVDRWEDMPQDRMAKAIDKLEKRLEDK